MINTKHLENTLSELATHYKKNKLPQIVFLAYVQQLSILSQDEFDQAIKLWLFSAKSFPTPEEILAKINKSPRQDGEIQWQLIYNNQPHNTIANQIFIEMKMRAELRTIENLPAKEYSYREQELKKTFLDKYCCAFISALVSGKLDELLAITPTESPQKNPLPDVSTDLITPEQWTILRTKLKNLGIKI